jgi:hypothetical protein
MYQATSFFWPRVCRRNSLTPTRLHIFRSSTIPIVFTSLVFFACASRPHYNLSEHEPYARSGTAILTVTVASSHLGTLKSVELWPATRYIEENWGIKGSISPLDRDFQVRGDYGRLIRKGQLSPDGKYTFTSMPSGSYYAVIVVDRTKLVRTFAFAESSPLRSSPIDAQFVCGQVALGHVQSVNGYVATEQDCVARQTPKHEVVGIAEKVRVGRGVNNQMTITGHESMAKLYPFQFSAFSAGKDVSWVIDADSVSDKFTIGGQKVDELFLVGGP